MTTVEASDLDSAPPRDEAYEYSLLVEKGENASKAKSMAKWILGDCVRQLTTYYAQRTVKQYAADIKEESQSLYEYSGMASFFSLEVRESLAHLNLSYSHFREARRLKDLDKAIEFLETAANNYWTVDDMRQALKALRMSGHTVADTYGDAPPMTDLNNVPVEPRMNYQWRGRAIVRMDSKGHVQLECETPPDLEPDKQYMVIFQAIDS
jgi:hypothetical protein